MGKQKAQPATKATTAASISPVTVWPGEIPLQSFYTAGLGGQLFFSALKDKGQLVATRCQPCKQVYLPARAFCERCFAELTEKVTVKPEGTLSSFTFSTRDRDGQPLAAPEALALVRLDGATTLLLHRLLNVADPSGIRIGARVKVVIKPKAQRTGSILDIEGFSLL